MATRTPPTQTTSPLTTGTPCDARCPATALVMVSKATTAPPGWTETGRASDGTPVYHAPMGTPPAPPGYQYLTFCGHHYRANEPLLAIHGWRVVADLRTWKGDE